MEYYAQMEDGRVKIYNNKDEWVNTYEEHDIEELALLHHKDYFAVLEEIRK